MTYATAAHTSIEEGFPLFNVQTLANETPAATSFEYFPFTVTAQMPHDLLSQDNGRSYRHCRQSV